MAGEIEGTGSEFAKWTSVRPNGGTYADRSLRGWEAEISHIKGWMKTGLNGLTVSMLSMLLQNFRNQRHC